MRCQMGHLHIHATVDLNDLAGHIARHIAGEEGGDIGDVVDLTAATQRNFLNPFGTDVVGQSGCHRRLDKAGGYGIGTDSTRADLLGDALGQSDKAGLRSSVVRLSGIAVDAYYRSHVDDRAAALAHHDGQNGVDKVESALEVHADD